MGEGRRQRKRKNKEGGSADLTLHVLNEQLKVEGRASRGGGRAEVLTEVSRSRSGLNSKRLLLLVHVLPRGQRRRRDKK